MFMPYNSGITHSKPHYPAHKAGRFVVDSRGILRGVEGDLVDLHAFFTESIPFIDVVPIETKVMRASGLLPGGFALVNRAGKHRDGSIVVVRYNGQIIIRRLEKRNHEWFFVPDDPRESTLPINEDIDIEKIGVVIAAVTKYL